MDLHGGVLTAVSEGKDKGATFTLELTTVPAVPEEGNPVAAAPEQSHSPQVLLVEDHEDTLRIMAKLLRSLGYRVTLASNVREALHAAENHEFAVLVSDIALPDGSGLDIIRKLRAKGSSLKGIAVSGFGQPEDLTRSREAGFRST